jgi:hypothetical protein
MSTSAWTARSAQQRLDEVHRPAQLEAFDVDGYLERLAAEVAEVADVTEGNDQPIDRLHGALAGIDAFASRVMRVALDQLLAADTSVAPPFRNYLASSLLEYEHDLALLRERVYGVAARVDPDGAADTATAVTNAADDALGLRARLRQGVLAMITAAEPPAEPPAEEAPEPEFFALIELD